MSKSLEYVRMLYGSIVRRRSTVRIAAASSALAYAERPVFVVGLYRSGTTLLRYVLDSHSRLAVPPESDFLQELQGLWGHHAATGLTSMGYDPEHVVQRCREFADYFFVNYARSRNKPRWVDKSPLYVNHLDGVERIYPDAQYLLLYRHPMDQIHSLTKGGSLEPDVVLAHTPELQDRDIRVRAAHYWRRRTGEMLEREWAADTHSIRYEDMCVAPRETLEGVFEWLGEDWEEEVLDFNSTPHDYGKEAASTRASREFQLRHGEFMKWPEPIQDEVWDIVRDVARLLNYQPDMNPVLPK